MKTFGDKFTSEPTDASIADDNPDGRVEEEGKKEDADSTAPATLATPSALFKCGEVRKNYR